MLGKVVRSWEGKKGKRVRKIVGVEGEVGGVREKKEERKGVRERVGKVEVILRYIDCVS